MTHISERLRKIVVKRAANRCEYCGLSQEGQEATFHVDHIITIVSGGETILENLALACVSCSLRKAARETGRDPISSEEVRLYHPRRDVWSKHFYWDGIYLVGLTSIGRATAELLQMN